MHINEVTIKDLKEIYDLEKKVFNENAFSKNLIKKLINHNKFFLKIVFPGIKKELIGFIIVIKDLSDRANIINFLINPSHQKKGYGTLLLQKTINKIKDLPDIEKVVLNVQISNKNAIHLYQKIGFKILCKIDNYYRSQESAYFMCLTL
jgi:ribosomal protein S18 acetylase RimI-like enzyme